MAYQRSTANDMPMQVVPQWVRLAIRLMPRALRDGVDGIKVDGPGRPVLARCVKAPSAEGAAKAAFVASLATNLELRRFDISILSGETGRTQMVLLKGKSADFESALRFWLAQA